MSTDYKYDTKEKVAFSALAITNPLIAFGYFAVLGIAGSAIGDEIAGGWQMIFEEIFGLYIEDKKYEH